MNGSGKELQTWIIGHDPRDTDAASKKQENSSKNTYRFTLCYRED